MAVGERVLVEDERGVAGGRGAGAVVGAAPVGAVVLALLGPGLVPPRTLPERHRRVGLEDACLDLLVELVAELAQPPGDGCRPRVLGLEVGGDRWVGPVRDPGVGVLECLSVVVDRGRAALGARWAGPRSGCRCGRGRGRHIVGHGPDRTVGAGAARTPDGDRAPHAPGPRRRRSPRGRGAAGSVRTYRLRVNRGSEPARRRDVTHRNG